MRVRFIVAVQAVTAAALLVPVVLAGLASESAVPLSHAAQTLVGVLIVWACAHKARAARGREAVGWWAGSVVGILTVSRPLEFAAQWFLGYQANTLGPLASLGIVAGSAVQLGTLARPLRFRTVRIMRALDVVSVGAAVAAVGWQVIVVQAPANRFDRAELIVTFLAVAAPALLGGAWAMVLITNTPARRNGYALPLLGGALTADAACATIIAHNIVDGAALFGHGVPVISLLASVLRALACSQEVPDAEWTAQKTVSLFWMSVPYLPVVLSIAAVAGLFLWTGKVSPLLLWALLAVVAVAMVRQYTSLLIIRALVRQLDVQRGDLDHMAHHDSLTGLTNRASFQLRATALLAATGPGSMTAVMLLDLDGFKAVNDNHGHAAGDQVLVAVGELLKAAVRPTDAVSRLGGDEFVVLLPHLSDPADAEVIAARIIERLGRPIDHDGTSLHVGVSIGIALATSADDDIDTVLHYADEALYTAKSAGKNTYRQHGATGPLIRT